MNIKTLGLFIIPAACYFMVACSSDSAPAVPLETPIGDISGDWSVYEVVASSVSECNGTQAYEITITQTNNSLSITGTAGGLVTGTISASALKLSGSRPYDSGTITYSSITGTVNATCTSMNLNTTWTYTEPGFSCTGSGTMEANRTGGASSC